MKDLANVPYHKTSERLVEILCQKIQNDNPAFFRISVGYFACKMASMMRTNITTKIRGTIPINMYAINLATSGYGKGHSTNIMEEQVIGEFKRTFIDETFPEVSKIALAKLAAKRAIRDGIDEEESLKRVNKEFDIQGTYQFSFDSATPAAIKQLRQKLLMSECGSLNMEIDEIGSNLLTSTEALTTMLELYDVGKIKPKITKNTAENVRSEEIDGKTPTNCLMYGTPAKLMDGGRTEQEATSLYETGYARRSFFGLAKDIPSSKDLTPLERYELLVNTESNEFMEELSVQFAELANIDNFGHDLWMSKDNEIDLLEYEEYCKERARTMPEHHQIQQAEITHRYFKAMKLAGAYAFMDGSQEVKSSHLWAAIKLAEDSGAALQAILLREQNYVKLAKYICSSTTESTHADLTEQLPFYKGNQGFKADMLTLAIAYGYRRNMVIKKTYIDGIEFLSGECLKVTDINAVTVSYSDHAAYGYSDGLDDDGKPEQCGFSDIGELTTAKGMHWTTHRFVEGHRKGTNVIAGFDVLVLDVDEGIDIKTAQLLMQEYTYHIHTTKRSNKLVDGVQHGDRFRMIFPLSHHLKLNEEDYKSFMENIAESLPFGIDDGTFQRCKKWETYPGEVYENEGKIFDALAYIPKTAKNEARKSSITDQASLDNMQRWFVNNSGTGNRSQQMIKYGLMLVDAGKSRKEVQDDVLALNERLTEPLDEAEVASTILVSTSKAIDLRDGTGK